MDTRSREQAADESCCPKTSLEKTPLLSVVEAAKLEVMFKTLANGTRLQILHALLREPRLCVTEIADALGMSCQAISNQLQRLADRGIVEARRNGNQIQYRVIDPCVTGLLEYGWCLAEDSENCLDED